MPPHMWPARISDLHVGKDKNLTKKIFFLFIFGYKIAICSSSETWGTPLLHIKKLWSILIQFNLGDQPIQKNIKQILSIPISISISICIF